MPGADGVKKMNELMTAVRENPPKELGGVTVDTVLDILKGSKTLADGTVEKLAYPQSDVLYFGLKGGGFVCVRPSGTEPKIKLYVNVNHKEKAQAETLLKEVSDAARKLLSE